MNTCDIQMPSTIIKKIYVNDNQTTMLLGAIWCPDEKRTEIATRIWEIKQKHGLAADFEIKWTKVSQRRVM